MQMFQMNQLVDHRGAHTLYTSKFLSWNYVKDTMFTTVFAR